MRLLDQWNKNKFSIYKSEEKTVLKLIKEIGKWIEDLIIGLDGKTDLYGDHKGSWQGLNRPTLSEEGMRATVERLQGTIGIISVKQFGAKGDSITDDTLAIQNANDYCKENKLILKFPSGVYKCTDGIIKKCDWIGEGTPSLGTFPLYDDKIYLREGYKNKLKGSVLLFCGEGKKLFRTQRDDKFTVGSFCVLCETGTSHNMENIAIVQDMNCLDSEGVWTSIANTNKAKYDYGYIIDDGFRNIHRNVIVFGYFNVSGLVISGRESAGYLGDPDYNSFMNCTFTGDIGVSIIGSKFNDNFDGGMSGSKFIDCQIFSADHHARSKTDDYWGSGCIYIDGYTDALSSNINGHYFNNCCIRTYTTNPIILDHCSNLSFIQCVFETPTYDTPNSQETEFLATEQTSDIIFNSCRFSGLNGLNKTFGSVISKLIIIGEPYDDITLINKGYLTRLGNENNKPFIQFGNDLTSKVKGYKIQSDLNSLTILKDNLVIKDVYSDGSTSATILKNGGSKTIVDNTITISNLSFYSVATDGINTNLSTINGGVKGQRLTLKCANNSSTFTLQKQVGNIRTKTDIQMTNIFDRVELEFDGAHWVVVSFSDNA